MSGHRKSVLPRDSSYHSPSWCRHTEEDLEHIWLRRSDGLRLAREMVAWGALREADLAGMDLD